jgi:hypothetical protein
MTSETIPILTAKDAKKANIGTPVTRPYPCSTAIAAVWRGQPPKPARTSHQFRAQLYRDLSHTL